MIPGVGIPGLFGRLGAGFTLAASSMRDMLLRCASASSR
jgi:hypothetical protein